jgi:hemerythrin superfamily protein
LSRRQEVFSKIDQDLCTHASFEERQVYPLLVGGKASHATALETLEEHLQIKRLLNELRHLDPQDERWMAKAKVLMEDVSHHVREEEGEVFPQLRKDASAETLQRLAQEYQALKGTTRISPAATAKVSGQSPAPRSASSNTTPPQQAKPKKSQTRTKAKNSKETANDKEMSEQVLASDETAG